MSNEPRVQVKSDFSLPFFGAILIHLLLGGLLFGSWQLSHKQPEEFKIPDSIRAEVVVLEKPMPVAKPKVATKPKTPVKPKTIPKPKPVVKETPKPAEKPKVKETPPVEKAIDLSKTEPAPVAEKEPEPVKEETPEPVEPEVSEADMFSDLLAGLAAEENEINEQLEAIEQSNTRQAEINAQVGDYIQLITIQVEEKWSRPVELRLMNLTAIEALVTVELLPTGELQSASIAKTSGIENYDQSVLRAIEKVRRFKVPSDSEVFEAGGFRRLNITFRPEDLMKP